MSDFTKSVLVDSDEEVSESEDSENDNTSSDVLRKRKNRKRTKAELNKKRRRNIANFNALQEQRQKVILTAIEEIPILLSQIDENELEREKNKLMAVSSAKSDLTESQLTYDEAGTVPLTEEISGSIRRIKPLGNNLKLHLSHMMENGDVMKKGRRARRAYEQPHAGKKVRWVARYKYV